MSLLYDASLIVTPNAYKESKLYALKPQSGLGDMTVIKATTDTRTNSAGLIENVPYNLLSYSEDFSNSAWAKNSLTITPNVIISPSGVLNATRVVNTSNANSLYGYVPGTFSGTYVFSFYAKSNGGTKNYIGIWDRYGVGSQMLSRDFTNELSSTEWIKISISITVGVGSNALYMYLTRDQPLGTVDFYIWGAQLVQGSVPKDYFPTTDRLNVPRIDYSNGSCPSILLEPQRTNLVTDSETYSSTWGSNFTSITKNLLSPSGIDNASTMINNVGANTSIFKLIPVVSGNTYKFTFYIKKISGSWASTNALQLYAWGPAVASPSHTDIGTIVTTNWVRYTHTFTASSTGNAYCQLISNELHTFGLWGAQLEVGAYPTSYIPTVASTVTRNADVCFLNNIYTNGLISASGGTWFLDQMSNEFKGSGLEYSILLGSVGQNSLVIGINTDGTISFYKWNNSIININQLITNSNVPRTKIIVRWNVTTGVISIFLNGTLSHTFTSQSFANYEGLSLTDANAGRTIGSHKVNSSILFPTQLTDAECVQLTTL